MTFRWSVHGLRGGSGSAPLTVQSLQDGDAQLELTFEFRGSSTFRWGCGLASDAERPGAESFPLVVFRGMVASCLPPRPPSITGVVVARLPPLQVDPLGAPLALLGLVMVVAAV